MFSDQANGVPTQLPYRVSEDAETVQLLPEQVREIIRLFQCPICSYPLRNPVTLPCGKTLCQTCIPETHIRANISYPASANRLQGFKCPFSDCDKEHAVGDCGPDVVLNKALTTAREDFEKQRQDAAATRNTVEVTVQDQWAIAGVSSLGAGPGSPHILQGGRLLAAYILAERGELDYYAEISSITALGTTDNCAKYDGVVLKQVQGTIRPEMDCQICYAMYYDPVTTACGHTFCRHCLQRVLDHASYCPVCRRGLSVAHIDRQSSPPNELVERVTTTFWVDDLELRKHAILAENGLEDTELDTPIFVCTISYPAMPTFLHVFEPRYRLMIRRALEADRTFGMVLHRRARTPSDANFMELGTLLHIANVEFFPDGRSVIETVGVSRFKIIHHTMLDGYVTAKTEKINDISIADEEELESIETRRGQRVQSLVEGAPQEIHSPAGTTATTSRPFRVPARAADLETMATQELMDFGVDFVRRMRDQSVTWLTNRMLAIYGECPQDPAIFPWWFGSILPVTDEEKYRLLGTASVRERLKICCEWILEWESRRWSLPTCALM